MRVVLTGGGLGAMATYIAMFKKFKEIPGSDVLFSKFEWIASSAGSLALAAYVTGAIDDIDEDVIMNLSDQLEGSINIVQCIDSNLSGLITREMMRVMISKYLPNLSHITLQEAGAACGTKICMLSTKLSMAGQGSPCILEGDYNLVDAITDSVSVPGLLEPRQDQNGNMYVDGDIAACQFIKYEDMVITMSQCTMPSSTYNAVNVVIATLNFFYNSFMAYKTSTRLCLNMGIHGSLFLYSSDHVKKYMYQGESKAGDLFSMLTENA